MSNEILKVKINNIAKNILNDDDDSQIINDKLLHIILSESSQALEFVCTIEDEFDIEFDDDEIDIDFFSSFDQIVNCLMNHLQETDLESF
jgi:acyl carrier protein